MPRKTYFLMPDFDHPPGPNSLVQLGQIITSPKTPNSRLAAPFPIPAHLIQHSTKLNYAATLTSSSHTSLGVWLMFLSSFLGIGTNSALSWARDNRQEMHVRVMEASFFEPDEQYLRDSVAASEAVREHINRTPGKALYMVTGVKIARGARSIQRAGKSTGLRTSVGVNATVMSGGTVPLEGGPAFRISNTSTNLFTFGATTDFVYAYRLLRIIPKPHGKFKTKRYEKGAETYANDADFKADVDEDEEEMSQSREMEMQIKDVEFEGLDYGAVVTTLPFEAQGKEAVDEFGEQGGVFCVVPGEDEEDEGEGEDDGDDNDDDDEMKD